ncbi:hypothetical protein ACQ4PT_042260 [Festuca glaucescens]
MVSSCRSSGQGHRREEATGAAQRKCRAIDLVRVSIGGGTMALTAQDHLPEPQKPAVLPDPVVRGAAEPRPRDGPTTQVRRPVEEEAAGVHHGANADGATAASALDDGGAVGLEQRKEGAPVSQQVLGGMPGSKMAPQVLGGEVEDSMARPSCRSSDGHVTCAPSPPH